MPDNRFRNSVLIIVFIIDDFLRYGKSFIQFIKARPDIPSSRNARPTPIPIHQLLHIREIAEEEVFLRTTLWYQDFCFEHCTAFEMKISDKLSCVHR